MLKYVDMWRKFFCFASLTMTGCTLLMMDDYFQASDIATMIACCDAPFIFLFSTQQLRRFR